MPDRLKDLESLAMKNEDLPDDATMPEILFFQGMRNLHYQYRIKAIDIDTAKAEKHRLVEEYKRVMIMYNCWTEAILVRNLMSDALTDAEKNGCLRCQRLVRIFDGRERT